MPEPLILGLHALGYLAKEPDKCFTTVEIATGVRHSGTTPSKVLQRLNKGGLIKSMRGPGGGYKFDCVPEETPP